MDLAEFHVEPVLDVVYCRVTETGFAVHDPELTMLIVVLTNILSHDNCVDNPTEVIVIAAHETKNVHEHPNKLVIRRNGALSGSALANEPGLKNNRFLPASPGKENISS